MIEHSGPHLGQTSDVGETISMVTPLSTDTAPHIERLKIERLRQMPAWRKLALVGEMNQAV
jgi:hypothetical protein